MVARSVGAQRMEGGSPAPRGARDILVEGASAAGLPLSLAFQHGRAVRLGIGGRSRMRVHAAVTLVGIDADVHATFADRSVVRGRAIVVRPDQPVICGAEGLSMVVVSDLDTTRRGWIAGDAIERIEGARATRLVEIARESLRHPGEELSFGAALERVATIRCIAGRSYDAPVRRVLDAESEAPSLEGWSVASMVAIARASETHLRNRFAALLGISPRAWLRWNRVSRVLKMLVSESVPSSTAALAHGFADQSHFTRTCRELLGHPPTRLLPLPATSGGRGP